MRKGVIVVSCLLTILAFSSCRIRTFYLTEEQKSWFEPYVYDGTFYYMCSTGELDSLNMTTTGKLIECNNRKGADDAGDCKKFSDKEQFWKVQFARFASDTRFDADSTLPDALMYARSAERIYVDKSDDTTDRNETHFYFYGPDAVFDLSKDHVMHPTATLINNTFTYVHVFTPDSAVAGATVLDSLYLNKTRGFVGYRRADGFMWELQ